VSVLCYSTFAQQTRVPLFKVGCQQGIWMGQFPLLPPNQNKFSINLSGHLAYLVRCLTWEPSLIWNTDGPMLKRLTWSSTSNYFLLFACLCNFKILGSHHSSFQTDVKTYKVLIELKTVPRLKTNNWTVSLKSKRHLFTKHFLNLSSQFSY